MNDERETESSLKKQPYLSAEEVLRRFIRSNLMRLVCL